MLGLVACRSRDVKMLTGIDGIVILLSKQLIVSRSVIWTIAV
jgi:hypothetical protein